MNRKYLIICLLVILSACNPRPSYKPSLEEEKKLILDVIKAETDYFIARDIEGMSRVFADRAYTQTIHDQYLAPGEVVKVKGYENIIEGYERYFRLSDNIKYTPPERSDILIEVRGDVALVTYQENQDHPHHNIRVLEKIDGVWKLVVVSVHVESAGKKVLY